MKVAFGAQVAYGETQYGKSVQFGQNVLLEGQEAGKGVQFGVQAFSVPFAGVAFCHAIFWGRLQTAKKTKM